jgi:hypothetical protein
MRRSRKDDLTGGFGRGNMRLCPQIDWR